MMYFTIKPLPGPIRTLDDLTIWSQTGLLPPRCAVAFPPRGNKPGTWKTFETAEEAISQVYPGCKLFKVPELACREAAALLEFCRAVVERGEQIDV